MWSNVEKAWLRSHPIVTFNKEERLERESVGERIPRYYLVKKEEKIDRFIYTEIKNWLSIILPSPF